MANTFDVIIKGGFVVTGSGVRKADVAIKGEKIVAIKPGLSKEEAGRTIDASGKYVMPGVIDVHVHPVYEDDMGGLSYTAAFGGTTTLIHYAYAKPGMRLIDTIKQYQEEGLQKSHLDFGIHGALFDPASQVEEIPKAFELGVSSFKMFMTYAKLKWMTDDYHLTAAMDLIAECGGLAMVHAENGLVTDYLEDRSLRKGEDQKKVFLKTRPDLLEAEAIFRARTIAEITRCPLYVVHLSSEKGAVVLQQAKEEGQRVYGETCPQYLTMTDAKLQKLGPLAKIGPPLRTEKDRLALWKAIQKGLIDVVASDHAPKAKKLDDPFFDAPYGSPQAETMLTVVYDEGVNKKRIKPSRLVQLFSENPAKIFGFYPKKGTIQKGSDADLVIFDPKHVYTIKHENQHSGGPYTLYEGRRCRGKPLLVMQRGRILIEDGEMKGKPGEGKFLPTKITKRK
ncbi:MAG: dihydropyrimidinase [Thermodesulfobacteriota bacterium]